MNNSTHTLIFAIAAMAIATTSPIALAQEPGGQNPATIPVMIRTYKVKPGHVAPFEDIMRKYRAAFEKDGRQFFMVWRAAMGDLYEFTALSDVPGLQTFDNPNTIAKAYGERDAALMSMNLAQCIEGVKSQMWHLHPELSVITPENFAFASATFVAVRNASAQREDNADQRKIVEAHRTKIGKNFWTLHLDYGGDDYLSLFVTPVEKMGDLRNLPTLTKVLGADEAKRISAAREQRRTSRHPYVWQYRPALSFRKIENSAAASTSTSLRERLLGTWRVNPGKSPGANPAISKFERDGAFLRNTNGPIDSRFKIDGKEYAAPGNEQFDAVVWRQTGPRRFEHQTRKAGRLVYTVVTELAADGLSRTYRHTRTLDNGGTSTLEGVQDRVGGETDPKIPLLGHWRLRQESQWNAAGADALTYRAGNLSYTAKLDGQDYPVTTSTSIDTVSIRVLGADSWEVTGKKNGKGVYSTIHSLSADGKTITSKANRGDVVLEKVN